MTIKIKILESNIDIDIIQRIQSLTNSSDLEHRTFMVYILINWVICVQPLYTFLCLEFNTEHIVLLETELLPL